MFSLYALFRALTSTRSRRAFERAATEVMVLLDAFLRPGKLIAEVEAMRSLQAEADRIEATHPVRAELLRREAAHTGLR
ncbi:hypothetical protein [Piscinibacter sp.]|uniref:hypothetical protein n=1 Tax=Piscinibacter sp. TaxID=1903157 RepID=UPI002C4B0151|nr:hypothetical protein [Albitalea sp.]HUG24423.1 hypothetical protein [Albitalea sp.]